MRSVIAAIALASLALGAATGCGYRLAGGTEDALASLGAMAILTPRNDSVQPGVERIVADALRRELLRRGGADLTEDPGAAQLVVSGRVLSLATIPRSFSSVAFTLEYEVTMVLFLQAQKADGSPVAIDPTRLVEAERYLSSADPETQRKNREEALRRVSSVVASRFFDTLSADFAR